MFDIGFWELAIISILTLVVVGPERLPTVVRSVINTIRRAKAWISTTQSEVEHQLRIHELHENLKKAESLNADDLSPELKASIDELKQAAEAVQNPYEKPSKHD